MRKYSLSQVLERKFPQLQHSFSLCSAVYNLVVIQQYRHSLELDVGILDSLYSHRCFVVIVMIQDQYPLWKCLTKSFCMRIANTTNNENNNNKIKKEISLNKSRSIDIKSLHNPLSALMKFCRHKSTAYQICWYYKESRWREETKEDWVRTDQS